MSWKSLHIRIQCRPLRLILLLIAYHGLHTSIALAGEPATGIAALPADSVWVVSVYEYDHSGAPLQVRAVVETSSGGFMRRTETVYAHEEFVGMGAGGTHQLAAVYSIQVEDGSELFSCSRVEYANGLAERTFQGCDDDESEVLHVTSYDAFARPDTILVAGGVQVEVTYEGRHLTGLARRFESTYSQASHEVVLTRSFGYDPFGRLVTAFDENGTALHYSYDGFGRLTHVVRAYIGDDQTEVLDPLVAHEYYLSVSQNGGTYISVLPNYVRTLLYVSDGVAPELSTGYFDGLGRELQTQQLVALGTGGQRDSVAVTFPEYDDLSRPVRAWRPVGMRQPLPDAQEPPDHGYIPNDQVETAALAFYLGAAGNHDPGDASINRPFAETEYEASPLSREARVRAPGVAPEVGGSGRSVTYRFGVEAPYAGADTLLYTEAFDADNRWTRTYTDALGRERFVARGKGSDASSGNEEALTELVYDAADRLVEVRPPNYFAPPQNSNPTDWITTYVYDTRGQLLAKTTPDTRNPNQTGPGTHRYAYDAAGRLRYSQDPEQRARGHVAFTRYDPMGRVTTTGVGRPAACDEDLSGAGALEACWDELGPDGGLVPDVNGAANVHWEDYDPNWRTLYHYDDAAQTVEVGGSPVPRVENWPFDGDPSFAYTNTQARPVAVAYRTEGLWQSSGAKWQSIFFAYDAAGNVRRRWVRTQGAAHEWEYFSYDHDRQGRLVADSVAVGSHGLRHDYIYDQRGLVTSVRATTGGANPNDPDLVLEYAIDGAVAERHLGEGPGLTSIPYEYDVAGRLVRMGDVTQSGQAFAARYDYTPGGLISAIETRSATELTQACGSAGYGCADRWRYIFAYDPLARLTDANYLGYDVSTQDFMPHPAFDLAAFYDRQGNITGLTRTAFDPGPNGITTVDILTYEYAAGTNRLKEVDDFADENDLAWDAKPTTFVYDRNGSMVEMTETLAASQTRKTEVLRLDERHLPERLRISHGSDQIGVVYAYNADGQRIKKVTFSEGIAPYPDPHYALERYVRDGMRLVGTFDGDGNLLWWNLGGAAGLVGRLDPEMQTVLDEPLAIATARDDLDGQVASILNAALVSVGVDPADAADIGPYVYGDVLDIARDAVPDAVAAHTDPAKDPVGSAHYQLTLGPTTSILESAMWAYWNDGDLVDRFAEPAAAETAAGNAAVVAAAAAASFVEEPTGEFDRRYYIADHLGSIRAVVNEQGDVIEARDHYPYGLMMPGRVFVQGQETREGYTGHELDAETGMYYAGARYYMPALGRWTAVDPLASDYPSWSVYNYTIGNPILFVDPFGMDIWELDANGTIVNRIEDTSQDAFYIVDSDGNRLENQSISFEYGTVEAVRHPTLEDGRELTLFEISGDGNATSLFEFLADPSNTGVEWTHAKIGTEDSGRNVVGTSHQSDRTPVGRYLNETGYTLREVTHNHPSGGLWPSTPDWMGVEIYQARNPNVILNIYTHPGNYLRYDNLVIDVTPNGN